MNTIKTYYENSYLCKILNGISSYVKKIVNGSVILSKMGQDNFRQVNENSKIIYLLECLLNIMFFISNNLKMKVKDYLECSITGKIINYICVNMYRVISLVIVLFLITPHRFWNNWYGVIIMVGLYLTYMIWKNIMKNQKIELKRLDFSVYIYYIFLLMALLTSINIVSSLKSLLFYLTAFLIMIIIVDSVDSREKLEEVLRMIIFGIFITGLYAIYQWKIVGVDVDLSYTDMENNEGLPGRVFSTMGNPNNFAEILIMTLPLFAYKFFHKKKWSNKMLYAIMGAPVLLALVLTSSRSAWGAIFIAFMIFVIIRYPKYIPLAIILGIASIPFLPEWIIKRAVTVFKSTDGSIGYRGLIYKTAWPMLGDYWTTGIGIGIETFRGVIKSYPIHTKVVPIHTHNIYLQTWLEMGILGVFSFVYMYFRTIKNAFINLKKTVTDRYKDLLVIYAVIIIGIMIVGTVEYVMFYQRVTYIMFTIIALLYATINIIKIEK